MKLELIVWALLAVSVTCNQLPNEQELAARIQHALDAVPVEKLPAQFLLRNDKLVIIIFLLFCVMLL
jgi:hypothetical protein